MTEERRNAPEFTEIEIDEPGTEELTVFCDDCGAEIQVGELYAEWEGGERWCAKCFLKHFAAYANAQENILFCQEDESRIREVKLTPGRGAVVVWDCAGEELPCRIDFLTCERERKDTPAAILCTSCGKDLTSEKEIVAFHSVYGVKFWCKECAAQDEGYKAARTENA